MIRGSCLCRGFQFEISGRVSDLHRCHCSICRKATGAGAIAMLAAAHKSLKWVCGEQTNPTIRTAQRLVIELLPHLRRPRATPA